MAGNSQIVDSWDSTAPITDDWNFSDNSTPNETLTPNNPLDRNVPPDKPNPDDDLPAVSAPSTTAKNDSNTVSSLDIAPWETPVQAVSNALSQRDHILYAPDQMNPNLGLISKGTLQVAPWETPDEAATKSEQNYENKGILHKAAGTAESFISSLGSSMMHIPFHDVDYSHGLDAVQDMAYNSGISDQTSSDVNAIDNATKQLHPTASKVGNITGNILGGAAIAEGTLKGIDLAKIAAEDPVFMSVMSKWGDALGGTIKGAGNVLWKVGKWPLVGGGVLAGEQLLQKAEHYIKNSPFTSPIVNSIGSLIPSTDDKSGK